MKFTELESLMFSRGIKSLAEIARVLKTTPQAVSNWKARDQIPYHIVDQINKLISSEKYKKLSGMSINSFNQDNRQIGLSDILLVISEQLKIIILVFFVSIFFAYTNVKFIKIPKYKSWSTVLLPENKSVNSGLITGLASQFGVNLPAGAEINLSNPSLYPELIRSRVFAEKVLDKEFYIKKFEKKITLLAYLPHGIDEPLKSKDFLISSALGTFRSMIEFDNGSSGKLTTITVTSSEPNLSKNLAEAIISELEALNRFYKSKTVSEKILFINNRIESVKKDLEFSEQRLKTFSEQNRQVSSPALQLEFDRLDRDVEIQKSIYLTLKQQHELAKIEEVQETSIIQIVDHPYLPLGPSNINVKLSLIIGGFFGIGFGLFLAFLRSYFNNNNIDERRKLRRVKNFVSKKAFDFLFDYRVYGITSLIFLIGAPYYLSQTSKNPQFFGMYSKSLLVFNIIYIFLLIFFVILFLKMKRKNSN